jgi:orotidine-5'-phosphate decarboxylase
MIAAAVEGARDRCGVLVVTVLTSMDAAAYFDAVGNPVESLTDEVIRLAQVARDARAFGVVCSGHEVARVIAETGDRLATLVPGVRLAGDSANDQSRVVTPGDAARAGAAFIVLGRTVTAASDPVAAMELVRAELLIASS